MRTFYLYLLDLFRGMDGMDGIAKFSATFITFASIIVVAVVMFFITRKILLSAANKVAKKTVTEWDDLLLENKVFRATAHLVPIFILYHTYDFTIPLELDELSDTASNYYAGLGEFIHKFVKLYLTVMCTIILNRLLNTAHDIYKSYPISFHRSINEYIQLIKIVFYFLAAILIVSILINRDPSILLAGLGTMAAVLLLVFKDTILGLVASIQLSANKMLKIGDWIEMPSHSADGTVVDITLNTVKVQNWNNTITTIPTYALVSESFSNWKGMEESGGRRIKRSVNIDMKSVKFCSKELFDKLAQNDLIKRYVEEKKDKLINQQSAAQLSFSETPYTNLTLFRWYLESWLKNSSLINTEMTFLIRELQPSERGLPLEVYVFSKNKEWAEYENTQADILDHILAIISHFELDIFQKPSGNDLEKIGIR